MSQTIKQSIELNTFLDNDDQPTCAINYGVKGGMCEFLKTRHFGQIDVCGINNQDLDRRKNGLGTLIPGCGCIFKHKKD